MNNVPFNLLSLLLQICFAPELGGSRIAEGEGSHVGDLIRTKSGKVFLAHSSKKALGPNKDDYSLNDNEIKVT